MLVNLCTNQKQYFPECHSNCSTEKTSRYARINYDDEYMSNSGCHDSSRRLRRPPILFSGFAPPFVCVRARMTQINAPIASSFLPQPRSALHFHTLYSRTSSEGMTRRLQRRSFRRIIVFRSKTFEPQSATINLSLLASATMRVPSSNQRNNSG